MKGVLMSVLPIGMVVETTHDHGSTGRAAGGGGKSVEKQGAVLGDCIDGRRLGNGVAIATKSGGLIIGDEKNDILFSSRKKYMGAEKEKKSKESKWNFHLWVTIANSRF